MKFHNLVPRFVAANQFHPAAGAIELPGQQFNQGLVGRRVHRRGRDLDFQLVAERLADFIFGGARLELHGKQSAAGRFAEKGHNLREVEAIQVHYLVPGRNKVVDELLFRVATSVNLRQGAELGV